MNHKKSRRIMREHDLRPKIRRRFHRHDRDHDGPIFPNLAKDSIPSGPNQLWVSDITYVSSPTRFIYVAIILNAWLQLTLGYAIRRSIDARLTLTALRAAIGRRRPPPGVVHHGADRGSQSAAELYRDTLATNGLIGSMGRYTGCSRRLRQQHKSFQPWSAQTVGIPAAVNPLSALDFTMAK